MPTNNQKGLLSHREFEEELRKGFADFKPTKDKLPLSQVEFASTLSNVIDYAQPISVALECGKNSTGLSLPTTAEELNKALRTINALDKEYAINDCHTKLNISLAKVIVGGDINEVNYFAARLAQLPQVQIDKLESIAENPEALASLAEMIDFTYNTDYFVLIPNIKNTEDLARYYIFESGMVEMPQQWKDAIDLYTFGANIEEQEKGIYTAKGYVVKSGDQWQKVFQKSGIVPPEYRIDNYLKNVEVATEQNYNQVDGIINNERPHSADLTDGQTYDEILELIPETLERNGKPSILGQLQEAKDNVEKPGEDIKKKRLDHD